jgi:hypothetical protein
LCVGVCCASSLPLTHFEFNCRFDVANSGVPAPVLGVVDGWRHASCAASPRYFTRCGTPARRWCVPGVTRRSEADLISRPLIWGWILTIGRAAGGEGTVAVLRCIGWRMGHDPTARCGASRHGGEAGQPNQSHEVVGRSHQIRSEVDSVQAAVAGLAKATHPPSSVRQGKPGRGNEM